MSSCETVIGCLEQLVRFNQQRSDQSQTHILVILYLILCTLIFLAVIRLFPRKRHHYEQFSLV